MIFAWLFNATCMMLVSAHIVPHAMDIGFSAGEAATILSLLGASRAAGLVLMGGAADRIGKKRIAIICALFQAGAVAWLIWANELWMLYLFVVVYGFSFGGFLPSITALIGDTFGLGSLGSILGVLDVGWAIGAATGPIIGGIIFDINESYSMAFLIGAVAIAIVAPLIALIKTGRKN